MLSAQSQLYSTRADLEGLQRTRAQLEHAIAVLLGQAPAEFALTAADWNGAVPQVPVGVPSTLLQRRPAIAAPNRHVAADNAHVGIPQSAWVHNLSLNSYNGSSPTTPHAKLP